MIEIKKVSQPVWLDSYLIISIFGHLEQWNLPKIMKYLPKYVHNFAKYTIATELKAKNF